MSDDVTTTPGHTRRQIPAPEFPYQPPRPQTYNPAIGLIACGRITHNHLTAYKNAGFRVIAFCDTNRQAAEARRDAFNPDGEVYTDYRQLLARDDIEVVDLAAHPAARAEHIEAALNADKHVLSQKPFVMDLDFGKRMVALAAQKKRQLAVNQNGRWAPHFSYLRQAVAAGEIGTLHSAQLAVHWDHGGARGTAFEKIRHLILYDFAIHWFDILCCFMGEHTPDKVYSSIRKTTDQDIVPPLLAQCVVEYSGALASLVFGAHTKHGKRNTTYLAGSLGTLVSEGPDLNTQQVTLYKDDTFAQPELSGSWLPDGYGGTMGELLCAIEEGREPSNSARNNLNSLALAFAAMKSADSGEPVAPGTVGAISLD